MEFKFSVHIAPMTGIISVEVICNGEKIGMLHPTAEEWNLLRPMLIYGNGFFMDNEASVCVELESSVSAYTEGC